MTIGERIKTLRESHSMTQSELASICGVSDKAISTWENDKNIPRMGAIQKMADYFNIPKAAIVDGYTQADIVELQDKFLDKEVIALKDGNEPEFVEIMYYENSLKLSLNGIEDEFSKVFFRLGRNGKKEVLLGMLKRFC